jgi:hypothetical protein
MRLRRRKKMKSRKLQRKMSTGRFRYGWKARHKNKFSVIHASPYSHSKLRSNENLISLHWNWHIQIIEQSTKNKSIADPLENLIEAAGNDHSRHREFSNRSIQLSLIDNTMNCTKMIYSVILNLFCSASCLNSFLINISFIRKKTKQ